MMWIGGDAIETELLWFAEVAISVNSCFSSLSGPYNSGFSGRLSRLIKLFRLSCTLELT